MKTIIRIILLLLPVHTQLYAQHEHLSPLEVNTELGGNQTRSYRDIYVYGIDTLELPVKDDFSLNKFRKYQAKPTDPNVTVQKYYRLLGAGSVPMPTDTRLSKTVTNRITVSSDTVIFTPLSTQVIDTNKLTEYPILTSSGTFYPCYNIMDSTDVPGDISDTVHIASGCLVQDSVNVYFVEPYDTLSAVWLDHYAYHNYRYGVSPPTLGLVTFDGLNEQGYPYDFSSPTASGVCDYLTSKPIDLSGLSASDSVFLSFYYQPKGLGDTPETGDSLVLQFYDPTAAPTERWKRAWSVPGTALHRFKQVLVHVKQPQYLTNAFQFRFYNIGVKSGSIDHWHVDYVFLDRFRKKTDTISGPLRDDVAFQYQATTLLNNKYTSMPLSHFSINPMSFMRDTLSVFKRNNDIGSNVVGNLGIEVSYKNNTLFAYNFNPEIETPAALSNYRTVYNLDTLNIVYDTAMVDSCAAVFDVKFFHKTSPDFCEDNDTMRLSQVFSNYYAYDDATAEAAYGLTADPGVQILMANGFTLAKPDVISGVAIHFTPSVVNADNRTFNLTLWDNAGTSGGPGNIIYQETILYDVIYGNVNNKYHVYQLSSPLTISGTVYVGFKQTSNDKINVGFDLNTNTREKIYYDVGFGWNTTSFKGSLMVRPVFNSCVIDVVSVKDEEKLEENQVVIYPNPAGHEVNIRSLQPVEQVTVYDMAGQQLMNVSASTVINLEHLSGGVYILRVKTQAGHTTHRLVVEK